MADIKLNSDIVDTWPDWKLDSYSLNRRNNRRDAGEILPKPTKEQKRIAILEKTVRELRKAQTELVRQVDISNATDDHGHELKNLKALADARAAIAKSKEVVPD